MRQNANTIALFSEFEGDIVKRLRSPGVRWGLFAFRRSGLPMPTGLFLDAAPQPFGMRERRAGEVRRRRHPLPFRPSGAQRPLVSMPAGAAQTTSEAAAIKKVVYVIGASNSVARIERSGGGAGYYAVGAPSRAACRLRDQRLRFVSLPARGSRRLRL